MQRLNFKSYYFSMLLFIAMIGGGLVGYGGGLSALALKPIGDIFLNLLLTVIVPLVFFSVASAVAQMGGSKQFCRITLTMLATFLFTGVVAAVFMVLAVSFFPLTQPVTLHFTNLASLKPIAFSQQIVNLLTAPDFNQLFSHTNILPLIIFSMLVGMAASVGDKDSRFKNFLKLGADVCLRMITYIMYLAPLGFFAYFAVLVGELGPRMISSYMRVIFLYYGAGILYFIFAFSFYAYLAAKRQGIQQFWSLAMLPSLTALGTLSSAASIPVNLQLMKTTPISPTIYETVIPVGAVLHKDGSVMGGVIKIAFLFGLLHLDFSGASVLLMALGVSLLVGMVMGAIPSGGMLGEMLILSVYGFPPEALMVIAVISILIDPLATVLNVTGDLVCCMMIARMGDLNTVKVADF